MKSGMINPNSNCSVSVHHSADESAVTGSVIPASQLELIRSRKRMIKAIDQGQWEHLQTLDRELVDAMDSAVDDEQRNSGAVLRELSEVLGMYRTLVETCQSQMNDAMLN